MSFRLDVEIIQLLCCEEGLGGVVLEGAWLLPLLLEKPWGKEKLIGSVPPPWGGGCSPSQLLQMTFFFAPFTRVGTPLLTMQKKTLGG